MWCQNTSNYIIAIMMQRIVKKLKVIFKGGEFIFVMCLYSQSKSWYQLSDSKDYTYFNIVYWSTKRTSDNYCNADPLWYQSSQPIYYVKKLSLLSIISYYCYIFKWRSWLPEGPSSWEFCHSPWKMFPPPLSLLNFWCLQCRSPLEVCYVQVHGVREKPFVQYNTNSI